MSDLQEHAPDAPAAAMPDVRALTIGDLRQCLRLGIGDFLHAPLFGLFFGGVFALIGNVILLALSTRDMSWLIYPFAIAFPLIGPFAAVGLYEISRRVESGTALAWSGVLSVVWAQRRRELSWMAFVILFVLWVWMYQVRLLIALFLGRMSFATWESFFSVVFTTPDGWLFLAIGHLVGGVLALILFSVTVVSMPLLLDRDYDAVTAMIVSVRAVLASPVVMLGWGIFVTLCVLAACAPAFLGLPLVLPVLGHATWHLYRRVVV
ncbi:MAG: hypothetical protein JWL93_1797 [Hyphomicrobiales bacterium]|nr:hypothetical protein [Hyphomicrobiales bacterium]